MQVDSSAVGYFYVIRLVPELSQRRVKLGWTVNVRNRLAGHRCACPTAVIVATWACPRYAEQRVIKAVTNKTCARLGFEVFDADDVDALCCRVDAFLNHPRMELIVNHPRFRTPKPTALTLSPQTEAMMGTSRARLSSATTSDLPSARLVLAVRTRYHWTTKELGAVLGVHQGTVSRWEKGLGGPIHVVTDFLTRLLTSEDEASVTQLPNDRLAS